MENTMFLRRALQSENVSGLKSDFYQFLQNHPFTFLAIVLAGMVGILISYCMIREFIYKKFGYDCCPGVTKPIPRQQQLQQLEDERIALQLQQELEAAERQQNIEKKREERRSKYVKFLEPYTMVVKKEDIVHIGQRQAIDELETSRRRVKMLDGQNISCRSVVSIPDGLDTSCRSTVNMSNQNGESVPDGLDTSCRSTVSMSKQNGESVPDGLDTSCRSTVSMSKQNGEKLIRLPVKDKDKSYRHVDAHCSVCLLDYEPGESLIWSTRRVCQHAFHVDCILVWLSKGKKRCPMCRNFFVPGSSIDDKKVITHDEGDLEADIYSVDNEEQMGDILATDNQHIDVTNMLVEQSQGHSQEAPFCQFV